MSYFDMALDIDPNNVDALYLKGDAFRKIKNYDEAFTYFYKVLQIEPTHFLALAKSELVTARFGQNIMDGFIDTTIRDSEGRLVSHLRITNVGILNHITAENMVDQWSITQTVIRNGTEYDVHEYQRIREVSRDGNVWGGAKHYGIHIPNHGDIWMIYASYWMFLPSKGDTITYTYTVFRPVE